MSLNSEDPRIRGLIRYYYRRNRHLSAVYDAEDLFQETWIDLHDFSAELPSQIPNVDEHQQIRQAVGRAAERAFGKLRKRCQRGPAGEVQLECDPADCIPDAGLVMDLKQQIDALPSDERLVIEMLRSGYEGTEIAQQLKVSPQAVTRRKQKALKRLRQTLGEEP